MQTTLYFREGASDKVYQTAIEAAGGGFVVNFAYGRRGFTLQTGTKTQRPVSREEAEKIVAKLISGKQAKGYTIESDGTPYSATGNEGRDTGIRCQLLNPVEEDQVEALLQDSRHAMQEKHDGRRLLIRKQGDRIEGINRRGFLVGIPATIQDAARAIPVDFLIDGEAVGDALHAFDLLEVTGHDVRQRGYFDRYSGLIRLLEQEGAIRPVVAVFEPAEKLKLFHGLRHRGAEGVVFKDGDSFFTPGRPASGGSQLKFKFVASASFLVDAVNKKRSVALALFNGAKRVPAGNVTIPPHHEIPSLGAIVEVRYLHAFRQSGSIYQPVFIGRRDDLDPTECQTGQLKYKEENVGV